MARFTGLLGLTVFIGIAYAVSTNRRAIRWRTVAWGLGLQFLFAFIVLDSTLGQRFLAIAGNAVNKLLEHSVAGSTMVFGPLGGNDSTVAIFAFRVLPTIIFISAFFAVLYYIGFMQLVIRGFAWIMQKTMGIS
ncbi:MAG: Na+ dependent nucleoside transporter N-terminal domain-containing protein, partial [Edaphobacter sp.]